MRIKEYVTFEFYEHDEQWHDETLAIDLDSVSSVKEYKGLINKGIIEVNVKGHCYLIEMEYNVFMKDWKEYGLSV